MAVVLDATVAGAAANSYLTVAAADALAEADVGPEVDAWQAAGAEQRAKALLRATREVDAYLRTGWPRWAPGQRLRFPRAMDGLLVPEPIRLATYEQATYVLRNAATLDQAAVRRARGLTSVAEPNVSYTRPNAEAEEVVLSPAALHYLQGYRTTGTRKGIRSVRMAGGYRI